MICIGTGSMVHDERGIPGVAWIFAFFMNSATNTQETADVQTEIDATAKRGGTSGSFQDAGKNNIRDLVDYPGF
jgi:hypothetical protein